MACFVRIFTIVLASVTREAIENAFEVSDVREPKWGFDGVSVSFVPGLH